MRALSSKSDTTVNASNRVQLGRTAAIVVVAYAFALTMLGTTLPTPLYPLYRQSIGFGEFMLTVVFAVYAVGVLAALFFGGGLSDQIGRRRVLIPALVISGLSAVCFVFEGGLPVLFVGRVLSGLSAGLCAGTATATLVDLVPAVKRARATLIATLVSMAGLGLGPLLSGVVSTAFGAPLRVAFMVDVVLLIPALIGLYLIPESVKSTARHLRLTHVNVALPPQVRAVFLPASLAGFAGFMVLGLITAAGPSALGQVLGVTNRAAVGAIVFSLFAGSAAGQILASAFTSHRLPIGCGLLAFGTGLLIVGLQVPSLVGLVIGCIVSGLGQGFSFRAAMEHIGEKAPNAQRGGVISLFYIVLYAGISIPVVGVGVGAEFSSLQSAGTVCAGIVAVLAVTAGVMISLIREESDDQAVLPKSREPQSAGSDGRLP
jgi:MFS family permease